MTNATHTVTCLLIRNHITGAQVYITGFLTKSTDEEIVIATAIHQATGLPYQEISIKTAHIIQRYDLPVTFW